MLARDHLTALEEYFAGWNRSDLELLSRHLADDFVLESDALPEPVRGPEGMRRYAARFLRAFPDLHFRLEDTFVSDDVVTVEWMATGTHTGPLDDTPPTHRRIRLHGCTVARFDGQRIRRTRVYWDARTLRRQLGLLPAPDTVPPS